MEHADRTLVCAGCGHVIAYHEHVWFEDEHRNLRRWSPELGSEPRLAVRRAWHAACVIDDSPPISERGPQ